jgi:hypothetical protein
MLIIKRQGGYMICPECKRDNLEGARVCDQCGTPLPGASDQPTVGAIGPTRILTQSPPATATAPVVERQRIVRSRQLNSGLWLIGLGLLFLTGTFWPGILVLVGISGFLEEQGRDQPQKAVRTLIFMSGLALLFWSGWFWPGILILVGVTTLLSPEVRPRRA